MSFRHRGYYFIWPWVWKWPSSSWTCLLSLLFPCGRLPTSRPDQPAEFNSLQRGDAKGQEMERRRELNPVNWSILLQAFVRLLQLRVFEKKKSFSQGVREIAWREATPIATLFPHKAIGWPIDWLLEHLLLSDCLMFSARFYCEVLRHGKFRVKCVLAQFKTIPPLNKSTTLWFQLYRMHYRINSLGVWLNTTIFSDLRDVSAPTESRDIKPHTPLPLTSKEPCM